MIDLAMQCALLDLAPDCPDATSSLPPQPGPGGLTPLHLAAVLPYPADAAMDLLSALPAETLRSWFTAAACDDCTPAHYASRGGNAHLNDHALMCIAMGAERMEGAAATTGGGGGGVAVEEAGAYVDFGGRAASYNGVQLRSLDLGQLPMDSGEVGRMAGGSSTTGSVPLESALEGQVAAAEAAGGRLRAAVGALVGSGRTGGAVDMQAEVDRVLALRHGGSSTEGHSEEGHGGLGVEGQPYSGGRVVCMLDDDGGGCGGGGGIEWGSSEAAGFHLQPRWGFGGGGSLGAGASRVVLGDIHSGSFAISRTLGRINPVRGGGASFAASPDGQPTSGRPTADTRRPRRLQSLTPQLQAQLNQHIAQGQAYQYLQHSAQHPQGLSAASAAGGGTSPPPMPPPLLPGAEQWLPESWHPGHVSGSTVRSSSWLNPQSLVAGLLDRVSPSPSGSHAGSPSASPMVRPDLWLPHRSDASDTAGLALGQLPPNLREQGRQQQQQEGGLPDTLQTPPQQEQQQQHHDPQAAALRTAIRSAVAAAQVDADAPAAAQEGEHSGGGGRRRPGRDQQWAFPGPVAPSALQEWVASAAVAGAALQQPEDALPIALASGSAGREAAAAGERGLLVSTMPSSQQQQQPWTLQLLSRTASGMSFSSGNSGGGRLSQRLHLAAERMTRGSVERMTRGSGPASHGSFSGPDGAAGPPGVQQVQLELRQLVPLQSNVGQQQQRQQHNRMTSTAPPRVQEVAVTAAQPWGGLGLGAADVGCGASTVASGGVSHGAAMAPGAASTAAPAPNGGTEDAFRRTGQAERASAAAADAVPPAVAAAAAPASSQLGVLVSGLALVAAVGTCLHTAPQAVVAVLVAVVSALLLQRLLLQH